MQKYHLRRTPAVQPQPLGTDELHEKETKGTKDNKQYMKIWFYF